AGFAEELDVGRCAFFQDRRDKPDRDAARVQLEQQLFHRQPSTLIGADPVGDAGGLVQREVEDGEGGAGHDHADEHRYERLDQREAAGVADGDARAHGQLLAFSRVPGLVGAPDSMYMLAVAGEPELPPLVQVPLGPLSVSLVKVVVYLRFLARPVVAPFLPPLTPPVTQSLNLPKGRPGCASAPHELVSVLRTTVLQPGASIYTWAFSTGLLGREEFFPL